MKSKKLLSVAFLFSPWIGLIVIGVVNSILQNYSVEKLIYIDPDHLIFWFGLSGAVGLLLSRIARHQAGRFFRIGTVLLASLNLIACIVSFSLFGAIDTGKARYTLEQMEKVSKVLSDYKDRNKQFPDSLSSVIANKSDLYDAWGCKLQYNKGDNWFELRSLSSDRTRQENTSVESPGKDIIVRTGLLIDGPETLVAWSKAKRSSNPR